jgi:putative tryptophan/tyrosine transport system substrate-binding protein
MQRIVGRRELLLGLGAILLASPTHAQKPPTRIGWLSAGSEPDPFLEAFRDGLRRLGYVEGRNVVLDVRHAGGNLEALQLGAADLARSKVALIVASLTAVRAARAIKDIPILFTVSGDPVEAGLAQSLARPGGNLTGSTFLSLEVAGKRVELLKEALLGCVRWPHYRILTIQGRSPSCRPPKQRLRASESV